MDNKAPDAFRTISEVADELDLPQHVLRFWESRFHEIRPMKRGGGRRYYRPDDIDLLRGIRHLLYGEGYTIRGVQRILRENGIKFVQAVWQDGAPQPPHGAVDDAGGEQDDIVADDIATNDVSADEPTERRGLFGRLPDLLGRDLNAQQDIAPARDEPSLVAAPVPHIDATDRAIHQPTVAMPPPDIAAPVVASNSAPAAPPPSVAAGHASPPRLSGDELGRLHAALHELAECRRLIALAITRE